MPYLFTRLMLSFVLALCFVTRFVCASAQGSLDARSIMTTNYASSYLGAKIVEQHKDAKGAQNLLRENKESYLNIPCRSERKYFTVQLSREIVVNLIAINNLEFFSSFVKNFTLIGSHVFPCVAPKCMWRLLGHFQGKPVRQMQLFPVPRQDSVRFLRFLWVSHYGNEKSCTMTSFHVYGTDALENFAADLQIGSSRGGGNTNGMAPPSYPASSFSSSTRFEFDSLARALGYGAEDQTEGHEGPIRNRTFHVVNFTDIWTRIESNVTARKVSVLSTAKRHAMCRTRASSSLLGADRFCDADEAEIYLKNLQQRLLAADVPRISAGGRPQILNIRQFLPPNTTIMARPVNASWRVYEKTGEVAQQLMRYIRDWKANHSNVGNSMCIAEELAKENFYAFGKGAMCAVEWGYWVSASRNSTKASRNSVPLPSHGFGTLGGTVPMMKMLHEVRHLQNAVTVLLEHNATATEHIRQLYENVRRLSDAHEARQRDLILATSFFEGKVHELQHNLTAMIGQLRHSQTQYEIDNGRYATFMIVWCCVCTAFSFVAMLCVALRPSFSTTTRVVKTGKESPNDPAVRSAVGELMSEVFSPQGTSSMPIGGSTPFSPSSPTMRKRDEYSHGLVSPVTPALQPTTEKFDNGAGMVATNEPPMSVLSEGSDSAESRHSLENTFRGEGVTEANVGEEEGEGAGGSGVFSDTFNEAEDSTTYRMLGELTDDYRASARDLTDLL